MRTHDVIVIDAGLAAAAIRLGRAVSRLRRRDGRWELDALGEETVRARDIVVAVGAEDVPGLVDASAPSTRGLHRRGFGSGPSHHCSVSETLFAER